jgi:hypothetical protein
MSLSCRRNRHNRVTEMLQLQQAAMTDQTELQVTCKYCCKQNCTLPTCIAEMLATAASSNTAQQHKPHMKLKKPYFPQAEADLCLKGMTPNCVSLPWTICATSKFHAHCFLPRQLLQRQHAANMHHRNGGSCSKHHCQGSNSPLKQSLDTELQVASKCCCKQNCMLPTCITEMLAAAASSKTAQHTSSI